jgi:uncharacterized protein (TIGR03086 family)
MTTPFDLGPAADQVKALVRGVTVDDLSAPTPCEGTSVAAMLAHVMGLTRAFTDAATKTTPAPGTPQPGPGTASAASLDPAWRALLPAQLDELVAAWRDPAAWEGMAEAGGVTLPADVMGMVALDELVLHGWDLARGTGQPFACDPASTQACFAFTAQSAEPGQEAGREGVFGPVVDVPADAPMFDRALGFSGRDPAWTAPTDR